jgi:hypothetical protein
LAELQFDLWITDEATITYERLRAVADAVVSSNLGPLPINNDSRLSGKLAAVRHYERTRKILRSIVQPQDAHLDMGLIGIYQWVRYRVELGTCVYFMRFIDPPSVWVLEFSESPLDRDAIRKLVASGNAHVLAKLRLPLTELASRSYATVH